MVVKHINTENGTSGCPEVKGCSWKPQHNRTDDPLGADASTLANTDGVKTYVEKLEISGEYKTAYVKGESFDTTGMVFTATWSDGTKTNPTADEVEISGFDGTRTSKQTVTIFYREASATITVTVRSGSQKEIAVTFSMLGDSLHESDKDGQVHTLEGRNLTTWISETVYYVDADATVYDVIKEAAKQYSFKIIGDDDNSYGSMYISAIVWDGMQLGELDNGPNSGWMDTVNDEYPQVGVDKQTLKDGDVIIFHYTDDYTKEGHTWDDGVVTKDATCTEEGSRLYTCQTCEKTKTVVIPANGHTWDEGKVTPEPTCTKQGSRLYTCTVCKDTKTEVIPANGHTWDEGKVATEPTCTKQGSRLYTCTVCKDTKTEAIPATGHTFGAWKTESKATVFAPKLLSHTCTKCGYKDTEYTGSALKPTIKVNAETITLKIQQKTSAFKVTGLANGDSVKSYKSGNTKLFTVDKKGVITATKKTGSAKLTITLASGLKKQVTVKVQKNAVTTTKITGLTSKVTVKKGAKLTLKPSRVPVTSTQKFTYATSNKKVATVSSAGVIKAKAAGTAKITVKSGSKKVVVTVTVPKTKTTAITVKTSVTVKKGKTIALNAKKTPANSDQKITYASANKKIATVTSAGKIKGVKKGTTTITVKSGNITKKIKVTVK